MLGFKFSLTGHVALSPATAIQWLLRDDFTDTVAAGGVDGTAATPGPGTRSATDVAAAMTVDGTRVLSDAEPNNQNDQAIIYKDAPLVRNDGAMMVIEHYNSAQANRVLITGLSTDQNSIVLSTDTVRTSWLASQSIDNSVALMGEESIDTTYQYALWLSNQSTFTMAKGGGFADWSLLYKASAGGAGTLYPFVSFYRSNATESYKAIRAVGTGALPVPLASDGAFGSSTDGAGHAETSGIGAGGSGLSWTDNKGAWSGGSATALSSGEAIRTVDVGNADVMVDLDITRTAGNASIMLRYTDDDNYLRCGTDGTNMLLIEKVSGTENTLLTTAITYSAGATMRIRLEGQAARVYYNDGFVSSTSSIDASLTGARIGLYTTDTGNSFDNLVAYASTGYTNLNQYVS